MTIMPWFLRKSFWNLWEWVKVQGNKPENIPRPPATLSAIKPVPLQQVAPVIPISRILVCPPDEIPADEQSLKQNIVYKLQVWLYGVFSPMQPGLPPIDDDPDKALEAAFGRLQRTNFNPPVLPAEFLGSPDLGALAVRGPYACHLEKRDDGVYQWDLMRLKQYEHHEGLHTLGATVLFKVNATRRALEAFQIDTALGTAYPGDEHWELAKKIALASITTDVSLVRHFNGVHLTAGAPLEIATRNHLTSAHPVCRLLWPYLFGTLHSNDIVTRGQMVPGGEFETIFSFTMKGMCQLFDDSYGDYRFVANDPAEYAKTRNIDDAEFDTPTQDNLEALFDVMHAHAQHYLHLYYPNFQPESATQAIRADTALGLWLDELNSLIPNGVGVSRDDVTFDSLARLIARCMYLGTVQHEFLGSFIWNYQLWTHRQPVRVYKASRREPLDVYQRLVNANYNLNVTRRALMYDFSYMMDDDLAKAALRKFIRELESLQALMEQQPWAVWKLYPKALKVNMNA